MPEICAGRVRAKFQPLHPGRDELNSWCFDEESSGDGFNLFFTFKTGTDFILPFLDGPKSSVPALNQPVRKLLSHPDSILSKIIKIRPGLIFFSFQKIHIFLKCRYLQLNIKIFSLILVNSSLFFLKNMRFLGFLKYS